MKPSLPQQAINEIDLFLDGLLGRPQVEQLETCHTFRLRENDEMKLTNSLPPKMPIKDRQEIEYSGEVVRGDLQSTPELGKFGDHAMIIVEGQHDSDSSDQGGRKKLKLLSGELDKTLEIKMRPSAKKSKKLKLMNKESRSRSTGQIKKPKIKKVHKNPSKRHSIEASQCTLYHRAQSVDYLQTERSCLEPRWKEYGLLTVDFSTRKYSLNNTNYRLPAYRQSSKRKRSLDVAEQSTIASRMLQEEANHMIIKQKLMRADKEYHYLLQTYKTMKSQIIQQAKLQQKYDNLLQRFDKSEQIRITQQAYISTLEVYLNTLLAG